MTHFYRVMKLVTLVFTKKRNIFRYKKVLELITKNNYDKAIYNTITLI